MGKLIRNITEKLYFKFHPEQRPQEHQVLLKVKEGKTVDLYTQMAIPKEFYPHMFEENALADIKDCLGDKLGDRLVSENRIDFTLEENPITQEYICTAHITVVAY